MWSKLIVLFYCALNNRYPKMRLIMQLPDSEEDLRVSSLECLEF
jgi:hypothetical protein